VDGASSQELDVNVGYKPPKLTPELSLKTSKVRTVPGDVITNGNVKISGDVNPGVSNKTAPTLPN
jgi:phage-related protein